MASLRKTKTGNFILCFRFAGQQYQRALKTKDRQAAEATQKRVEYTIFQLGQGTVAIPEGVDPGDFLVTGTTTPAQAKPAEKPPCFGELIELYLQAHKGQKAPASLKTERTHLTNLQQCLGERASLPLPQVNKADLETALSLRCEQVSPTTVMKERQTLVCFFKWAASRDFLQGRPSPAENLCAFQEHREKLRFRTLEEIEAALARGGLSEEEVEQYWACLYLTQAEIGEVLAVFQTKARHDFVYPMVALAAFTGMRRGEILRLRWSDVNFEAGLITARSRKQSRQVAETARDIPMHAELRRVLESYQQRRTRGQFVVCKADSEQPLSKDQAWDHFRRTLVKTRWERTMPSGKQKVVIGFHTFRHSFASNLAVSGVDQRLIDSLLGHQTEEMRKRYQHLLPSSRQAAVETLCFHAPNTITDE